MRHAQQCHGAGLDAYSVFDYDLLRLPQLAGGGGSLEVSMLMGAGLLPRAAGRGSRVAYTLYMETVGYARSRHD